MFGAVRFRFGRSPIRPSGFSDFRSLEQSTGLTQQNFADFLQAAQVMLDIQEHRVVNPQAALPRGLLLMSETVALQVLALARSFQYKSPYSDPLAVWRKLGPEGRSWLIENRRSLGELVSQLLRHS